MEVDSKATESLQEIARLANILIGDQCCESHENEARNKMAELLRSFEDDSFIKIKSPKKPTSQWESISCEMDPMESWALDRNDGCW